MSRERELLERAIDEWDSDRDLYEFHKVIEEIRDFLSPPEPEQDEEPEKYGPGMIGFIQYISDAGMSFTLDEPDDDSYPFEPVYTHPAPRPEFVRLSEEEVTEVLTSAYHMYGAICATENMLVRKNTINKSDPDSIDLQSRCRGDKL